MTRIDWQQHMRGYEESGATIEEYCKNKGLSINSFRNHRYALRRAGKLATGPGAQFEEFQVGLKFQISTDGERGFTLHGIAAEHLPTILRSLHAVSE